MKVYPVFLHRAKHAAKEVQKPWVSAPAFFGNHLAVSACGGYSEVVSQEVSGFHAATVAGDSADTDGVDFLPLLAESYPPETKYKKRPNKIAAPPPCGGGAVIS